MTIHGMRAGLVALAIALAPAAKAQDEVPAQAVAAIRAIDDKGYAAAVDMAGADDAVTLSLITWLRLREGGAPFPLYRTFLDTHPDWPDQTRLLTRAEQAMPKGLPAADVIAWFGDRTPETGEGAVRLAEALSQNGEPDRAKDVIRTAWRDLRLTDEGQELIVAGFADVVADLHAERVDNLLWRWRRSEAERMLDLLDDDQRALAEARIAYIRKSGSIDEKDAAVPTALKDHPGLTYDRYNWLADQGLRKDAVAILRARSTSPEALGEPFRWSGWRRSLARWEMRRGRAEVAYELASQHFLNEGSAYADLEWLAGFIQLTDLENPQKALEHFDAAMAAVDSPISVARMGYWQGRAYEALTDPEAAALAYGVAADHQTAFYGLLASEKVGRDMDPALGRAAAVWDPALVEQPLIRAALTLLAAGERGAAVPFFAQLGRTLSADDLAALGAALDEPREVYFAVLLGKSAATQGRIVPELYFPLHDLAEMNLPVDPALALSIARRESEFNAGVGSPVGALGLMQLMPATAEEVAGFVGVPYSRNRLTADWEYNATLGARYLYELQLQFGTSPVQIAAGYNAGPSRPEIWMDDRGDPRLGEVDVVDWIEHIPFRETRNYVMRVTESVPVYRARLTGETGPVRFTDYLKGDKPLVRPVARGSLTAPESVAPTPTVSTSGPVPPRRAVARPSAPSGPQGIRPIARPGGG